MHQASDVLGALSVGGYTCLRLVVLQTRNALVTLLPSWLLLTLLLKAPLHMALVAPRWTQRRWQLFDRPSMNLWQPLGGRIEAVEAALHQQLALLLHRAGRKQLLWRLMRMTAVKTTPTRVI